MKLLEVLITWLLRYFGAITGLRSTFGVQVLSFTSCSVEFLLSGRVIFLLRLHESSKSVIDELDLAESEVSIVCFHVMSYNVEGLCN